MRHPLQRWGCTMIRRRLLAMTPRSGRAMSAVAEDVEHTIEETLARHTHELGRESSKRLTLDR